MPEPQKPGKMVQPVGLWQEAQWSATEAGAGADVEQTKPRILKHSWIFFFFWTEAASLHHDPAGPVVRSYLWYSQDIFNMHFMSWHVNESC